MNDGKLDVAAFETRVNERATSEAAYEAALLKEAGVGSVSGEGGGSGQPAGGADATRRAGGRGDHRRGVRADGPVRGPRQGRCGGKGLTDGHQRGFPAGQQPAGRLHRPHPRHPVTRSSYGQIPGVAQTAEDTADGN
jgi:hypothetical protein